MVTPNPDLYKRMAEPYPDAETAQAAIKAFLDDVADAREKHRIAEVAMIAGAHAGGETVAMTLTLGDHHESPKLALSLYRQTLVTSAESHERAAAKIRAMAEEL